MDIGFLRQQLHKAIKNYEKFGHDEYGQSSMLINADLVRDVTNVFDSFQQVYKTGHWIQAEPRPRCNRFVCSKCGNTIYYPQRKDSVRVPYTSCPYCRAYMETIFTDPFEPQPEVSKNG